MSPSDKSANLLRDVPLESLNLMRRMRTEYFLDRNITDRTPSASCACWRRCGPWRRRMPKSRRSAETAIEYFLYFGQYA